jgi:hypothetical protein
MAVRMTAVNSRLGRWMNFPIAQVSAPIKTILAAAKPAMRSTSLPLSWLVVNKLKSRHGLKI